MVAKELPPEEKKKVIEKETVKILEKREERNEKGDTIALKDKDLRSFLPKKIGAYVPSGDFVGNPYQASGASFSNAEQDYSDGQNHLRITLVDYNSAQGQHAQEIARWRADLAVETRREKGGSFVLDDMIGWEMYHKESQRAEIMLAVSDRIMLTIIADNQEDTAFLKYVAKQMRLKTLANY
ncbi:MAG: hypothetical protein OHK0053_28750 [Microscillaceae bacterium]